MYAVRLIEQRTIPAHGMSIDRRTIEIVADEYNNDRICSLVCFSCAQTYTSWIGQHVVTSNLQDQKSPIRRVAGSYFIEDLVGFQNRHTFEDALFRDHYMQPGMPLAKDSALDEDE